MLDDITNSSIPVPDLDDFSKLLDAAFKDTPLQSIDCLESVIDVPNTVPINEQIILPIKPKISANSFKRIEIVEVDDDELNEFLQKDEKNKYLEIQKEIFRDIRFIDEQLQDIELKTRSYDKFSKSIFETKIAFIDQRLKHLDALSKINKDSVNEKKDLDSVKDITDLMSK